MQHGHLCVLHLHESGTPQKKEDDQSTRLGPKKTIYTAIEIKRPNYTCGGWGAPLVFHISKKKKNKDKFRCPTPYPWHPAFAGFLEIKEFFWLSN